MRESLVILASLFILISGCTKDNNPVSSGEPSAAISSLSGQIVGWKYSSQRLITVQYRDSQFSIGTCATAKIDAYGRFSISTLGAPPLNAEGTTVYPTESGSVKFIENSFSCSDSTARLIYSQLEVVQTDSFPPWIGWVARTSYNFNVRTAATGDFDVIYFYVTKDARLTGTVRAWVSPGDSTAIDDITHFDLNFKKGWNQEVRIYSSQTAYRDSNKTIYRNEYSLVNFEPYQGSWFYYGN